MQAINRLILGTVQFGLDYGINNLSGRPNQQLVNEILTAAYNSGIRCLDTAEAYGSSHKVIGEFHRKHPDKIFDIITKLPHHVDGSIAKKIEEYLDELKVTNLQGLLFHSFQSYETNKTAIRALNEHKRSGKVKYIGVSVYTNEQAEEVIKDDYIDIIQLPFNLFDNINLRGELLGKIKASGKQVHTRSAFLQGLFFVPDINSHKAVKSLQPQIEYLYKLSNEINIPIQKMALNYCLQQANIDNVLIGVDNIMQLEQNLKNADCVLSDKIIDEINHIKIEDSNLLNPSLWHQ
jgi:aryl-alcohol dehydrogenase-like predicted oxidoreductase